MDENANVNVNEQDAEKDNNQTSMQDLLDKIKTLESDNAKNKSLLDKALKEKGDLTKSLRAKQTAEEQEAEAKRLADEERQAKYDSAIAELNHIKATTSYRDIVSDEKAIENLIGAIADGDHASIAKIIENEKKAAVKAAEMQWLKDRPRVNAGNQWSGMTRQQIMSIADQEERLKAIALNRDLF